MFQSAGESHQSLSLSPFEEYQRMNNADCVNQNGFLTKNIVSQCQETEACSSKPEQLDDLGAGSIDEIRCASSPHITAPNLKTLSLKWDTPLSVARPVKFLACGTTKLMQMPHEYSTRGRILQPVGIAALHRPEGNNYPVNASSPQHVLVKDPAHCIVSAKTEPKTQTMVQSSHLPDKIKLYRRAPQPHCWFP
jgi:hypothetical protein